LLRITEILPKQSHMHRDRGAFADRGGKAGNPGARTLEHFPVSLKS
jgi:hypothetical protein